MAIPAAAVEDTAAVATPTEVAMAAAAVAMAELLAVAAIACQTLAPASNNRAGI